MKLTVIPFRPGGLFAGLLLFALALETGSVHAQPVLNFKRVVNNWPTIELYFAAACDGNPMYFKDKRNFKVYEDGVEIGEFELWCPDPTMRCAISVALVFDASGSMMGAGNAGAKAAGHAFIDLMDGVVDEASIIWFTSTVTVMQTMTVYKDLLHAAVNSLPANGATAVWNGIYAGIMNLINDGMNPCRAVIVLTDGGDNSSTWTPQDVISLANRNRIRVFTIGLGTGIQSAILQNIADLTGGRYYETPDPAQLVAIYQEISTIIFQGFQECMITYQAGCMDGATRKVDLSLANFCNGSDTKTKIYRAPRDTTTFQLFGVRIADTRSWSDTAIVALELTTPLPSSILKPASFQLEYDRALVDFLGIDTPPGSILEGTGLTVIATTSGIEVRTLNSKRIAVTSVPAPLAYLRFAAKTRVQDSLTVGIRPSSWSFENGCLTPVLSGGTIRIVNEKTTAYAAIDSVTVSGRTVNLYFHARCREAFVTTLSASEATIEIDGFPIRDVLWTSSTTTNGMKAEFVDPCPDGNFHTLILRLQPFCRTAVSVSTRYRSPKRNLAVKVSPSTRLCPGDSVLLEAEEGFLSYRWSTNDSTRFLNVSRAGKYWYIATGESGCILYSDTVEISEPSPPVVTPRGPILLCEGRSVILDAGPGYVTYTWSNGRQGRFLDVSTTGDYFVVVMDSANCVLRSSPVRVTVLRNLSPAVTALGSTVFCEGDSVTLVADEGYDEYLWSNGDTTRTTVVRTAGSYTVTVRLAGGCSGTSQPVAVTVHPAPKPAVTAHGPTEICAGDTLLLEADSGYVSYLWSSNATTRSIRVTAAGVFTVRVVDTNGCAGVSDPMTVTVHERPPKPMVVRTGDVLSTDSAYAYQWYLDGAEIPGATARTHRAAQAGTYRVRVGNEYGCREFSDPFPLTVLGTGGAVQALPFSLEVHPNPAGDAVTVTIRGAETGRVELRLFNTLGRMVYVTAVTSASAVVSYTIPLHHVPAGMYFLRADRKDASASGVFLKR
ncbi:MAG: VWA domain-containing protein [Bacteroidota bacterium]|nr:VWA domain-containing protein [Bacteroidota bacterium]